MCMWEWGREGLAESSMRADKGARHRAFHLRRGEGGGGRKGLKKSKEYTKKEREGVERRYIHALTKRVKI